MSEETSIFRFVDRVASRIGRLQTPYYRLLLGLLDDGTISEKRREIVLREIKLRDDTRTTVLCIVLTMFLALLVASLANHYLSTEAPTSLFLAALWGIAAYVGGTLVGFLFGVPRAADKAVPQATDGSDGAAHGPALTPNTNLEQISDWLTKILVGVGLVEARQIAAHAVRLAAFMASPNGGVANSSLALAILIGFGGLGFFMGYLTTRMFLSPVFNIADGALALGSAIGSKLVIDAQLSPPEEGDGKEPHVDPAAKQQARSIVENRRSPRVDDPFEVRYSRAKSLLIMGDYPKAAVEYGSLVADQPSNVMLRRERLWALFKRGPHWDGDVATATERLYQLRLQDPDPTRTYTSLAFHYLYANTIDAARRVIDLVQEYEQRGLKPAAGIYMNLACAYGMLARLSPDEAGAAAAGAAVAIKKALALKPASRARFRELADPTSTDNDLAVFKDVPAVREALQFTTSIAGAVAGPPLGHD